jgi:RND family efflux transporter MFP subunit
MKCSPNIVLSFLLYILCFRLEALETSPPPVYERFPVILEPYQHAVLTAEIFTKVVDIPFKLGDSFKKGDILIQFDNDAFKANVVKAQKELEKTQADLTAKRSLFKDNISSEEELKVSEANVATAEAELAQAQKIYRASEVRAPYDGKVAEVYVYPYEVPTEIKPTLLAIINDRQLIANFYVPSMYSKDVQIGDTVYVYINDTQQVIPSKIIRVSPVVNPASSTLKVESIIDNPEGKLKAGMPSVVALNPDSFKPQENKLKDIMQQIKEKDQQK